MALKLPECRFLSCTYIDLSNACAANTNKTREAELWRAGKMKWPLGPTAGDSCQGAVERQCRSRSRCSTEVVGCHRNKTSCGGRRQPAGNTVNVKQVVAKKKRTCLANMHGQVMKMAEGHLLMAVETKYQTLHFFLASLWMNTVCSHSPTPSPYHLPFANSPLLKGAIAC